MTMLDICTKSLPELIKNQLDADLEKHTYNLSNKIENNLNNKINFIFLFNYCYEWEKVDYFYDFMKCEICETENCKHLELIR